ncbi:MAG: hypothetical protein ACTHKA_16540 [Anaerocolumna jejuensis]
MKISLLTATNKKSCDQKSFAVGIAGCCEFTGAQEDAPALTHIIFDV